MRAMVTMIYRSEWFALPVEKRREISLAATAYYDKYVKSGQLKDTYTFGSGKLMSIWDAASFEEMVIINMNHPYYGLVDIQVDPFINHADIVRLRKAATTAPAKPAEAAKPARK